MDNDLQTAIDEAWENRGMVKPASPEAEAARELLVAQLEEREAEVRANPKKHHLIMVYPAPDGVGVVAECAWCGVVVGQTDQSASLKKLNRFAKKHLKSLAD